MRRQSVSMRHRSVSATKLQLTLFGGFEARTDSGAVLRFRTRKTQVLVAYLALETGAWHPRAKLAAFLWGDVPDQQARDSLRHAFLDIRRVLSTAVPGALVSCGDSVALDTGRIDVDVARFERLIAAASSTSVHQAMEIYRGELLDGIVLDEEPFDRWVAERRQQVRALGIGALERHLEVEVKDQRVEQAIATAIRLLAFDHTHEAVQRTLMRLYVQQGRRGTALRQYQSCVESLQRELGADPDPETRKLYEAILRDGAGTVNRKPYRESDSRVVSRDESPSASGHRRTETPLIGRTAELARLSAAVDAMCRGAGGCVFVTGEAGIGKTRLVTEVLLSVQTRARVLQARAHETERALPLGLWVDALRSAGTSFCLDTACRLDPVWRRELACLVPELASGNEETRARTVDERRLFEAVLNFLSRVADQAPLVVALDDLHWADDASVRLLAFVVRRIASARLLIIATLREEDVEDGSKLRDDINQLVLASFASALEVHGLSQADTFELVRCFTYRKGGGPPPAGANIQIWDSSRGNPFMIAEMVRAMREGATLDASAPLIFSDRVHQLVMARIQRLAQPLRAVLAVAAVIGREFEFALIMSAAQLSIQDAAASLEELVRRRFLHTIGDRFEFTHAWIRESVYLSMLPPRRQILHAAVAMACQQSGLRNDEPLLSILVHHYSLGKIWDKAALYARLAGEQATQRRAYAEAAALFEQARLALEHLPQDPEVMREAIDVRVRLHRSRIPTGIVAPSIENLREAETLLAHVDDPARRANVLLCVTEYSRWTGRHARAVESGNLALTAAIESQDPNLAAQVRFQLGVAQFWKGEYRSAISNLRQSVVDSHSLSFLPAASFFPVGVSARGYLALALASIGQFVEARNVATEATKIADEMEDPASQVSAGRALGLVLVEQGEFDSAVPLLERTLHLCEQWHVDLLYSLIAAGLGYAYAITGRIDEGVALMEGAVSQRESLRGEYHGSFGAYLVARLGEGCLLARRLVEAATYADRARDLAHTYANRTDEAWSLRLYGDLAAQQQPIDAAEIESQYRAARKVATTQEMLPFVAHCDLRIGKLHALVHEEIKSRAALRRARAAFAGLAMPYWVSRAEHALQLNDGV